MGFTEGVIEKRFAVERAFRRSKTANVYGVRSDVNKNISKSVGMPPRGDGGFFTKQLCQTKFVIVSSYCKYL